MATATAARKPKKTLAAVESTIALPELADGWLADTRFIVRTAYFWALDGPACGVDGWVGEVPKLTMSDLLLGASDLASQWSELSTADVMDALRDAMRFAGLSEGA